MPKRPPSEGRRPIAPWVRWAGLGACLLAAGVTAGVLTWPWTTKIPVKHPTAARFVDHNGVIIFEQQPSGLLGSGRPDGSGTRLSSGLTPLQGFDVPVPSPDGHFLVNDAGQIVTLGAAGAVNVAFTGATTNLQGNFGNWRGVSFADGNKLIAADECGGGPGATWGLRLAPASTNGTGTVLGVVDGAWAVNPVAGDPRSGGAFAIRTASSGECGNPSQTPPAKGDSDVVYERPGQAPHTVITARTLLAAFGAAPGTPVLLGVYPSPDGGQLAVTANTWSQGAPTQYGPSINEKNLGVLVTTRTGQVVAKLPGQGGSLQWSPDGKSIAWIGGAAHAAALIQIWPVGGSAASMTSITVPGPSSLYPDSLLWSPDGTQFVCAFENFPKPGTVSQGPRQIQGWTVVDIRTKRSASVTAPGQPVAWLPGAQAAR